MQEIEEQKKLPMQKIKTAKYTLGYDFNLMTFGQVMHAEERALLRSNRTDYIDANPEAGFANETLTDAEFKLDLAAILFTPIEGRKPAPYDKALFQEIRDEIENSPQSNYAILELALTDFFCKRGKRNFALKVMDRNEKLKTVLATYLTLMSALSKSRRSATPASSSDESSESTPQI